MELYLLRHGIAEDASASGRDADRALTPEGREKLLSVLRRTRDAGVHPARIVSSPYVRAKQTAELAASVYGNKDPVVLADALVPDSSPEAVWEEIRVHRDAASLLLAGHEPLFSAATAYLLRSPSLMVDFKKGAIVRIDLHSLGAQPHGVLRWMLTARLA